MNYTDDFYMVLTSNLYDTEYPNNKPAHFITPLAHPLELDKEKWQVGLAEICFPNGFNNILNEECDMYLYKNIRANPASKSKITIAAGFYRNGVELCKTLNSAINEKNHKHVQFMYDGRNDTASIKVEENRKLIMSESLTNKLGFEMNTFTSGTHDASKSTDLHYDTHYMYIYSNVVNEIPVGNSYVKLLRTVPTLEDSPERYITKTYDRPHYMNIASSFENNIEIGITTDDGVYFNFRGGKIIITLHFIKRK